MSDWRTPKEVSRYLLTLTSGAFVGTYMKLSNRWQDQGWEQSEPQDTCRGLPLGAACVRGQRWSPAVRANPRAGTWHGRQLPRVHVSTAAASHACMPWSARSKPVSLTGIGHLAQVQPYPHSEDKVRRMQRLDQRLVEAAAIPLTSTELPQSTNTESWRVLTTEDCGLLPPY